MLFKMRANVFGKLDLFQDFFVAFKNLDPVPADGSGGNGGLNRLFNVRDRVFNRAFENGRRLSCFLFLRSADRGFSDDLNADMQIGRAHV